MSEQQITRRLAAILAADIAGYSGMIGADEAGTIAALRRVWSETFNPAVAARHGRIVKMMGDGALVEFGSVVDAVECAVAIQRAMHERNQAARPPVEFRIGINLGDIVIEENDIFGDGVNVAVRLEGQAPQGGILASDVVHDQGERQGRRHLRGRRRNQAQEHRPTAARMALGRGRRDDRTICQQFRPAARHRQAVDCRPALRCDEQRPGAGILRRRPRRGHPYDPLKALRPFGDRAPFELRLQGARPGCAPGRPRPRRALRARGQRAQGRRPCTHQCAVD